MNLNHINLPVSDVPANRDFFVAHFGMAVIFELPKGSLAMLVDEAGMVLNLSHFDAERTSEITYPRDMHVGFFVDSPEEVDAVHARIAGHGVVVDAPRRMEGRYAFYIQAPGGFPVEVACLKRSLRPSGGPEATG